MKLHKHGMKVAERELERTVDKVQLWLMIERGTNDAMVIMRRVQKEHHAEGKMLYVFCGPRESSLQRNKESVGMGNEEERNTRSHGYISDETL